MWDILLNKCHTKLIHFFFLVRCRRTISMETGCQNIQLCATILKVAFSPEVIGPLYLFPLIYIVFQGGEALVFILLFRCYEAFKPKIEGKCHSWKYYVAWLFVFQFPPSSVWSKFNPCSFKCLSSNPWTLCVFTCTEKTIHPNDHGNMEEMKIPWRSLRCDVSRLNVYSVINGGARTNLRQCHKSRDTAL